MVVSAGAGAANDTGATWAHVDSGAPTSSQHGGLHGQIVLRGSRVTAWAAACVGLPIADQILRSTGVAIVLAVDLGIASGLWQRHQISRIVGLAPDGGGAAETVAVASKVSVLVKSIQVDLTLLLVTVSLHVLGNHAMVGLDFRHGATRRV